MRDVYDVAIIGMGAVGTATGFLLAEFTNVQSLLFLEKEKSAGQIASDRRTNSQTRHPFGGELNYSPEVMRAIKRYSDMIPSYATSDYGHGYDILRRTKSGMVLAVGKNEKDYLRRKFHDTVKPVFPFCRINGRQGRDRETGTVYCERAEEGGKDRNNQTASRHS